MRSTTRVFDDKTTPEQELQYRGRFQSGVPGLQERSKDQAVEAYRYAAENGQLGATWKLARMYAEGDGVARNDYEAFKFFTEIVHRASNPAARRKATFPMRWLRSAPI